MSLLGKRARKPKKREERERKRKKDGKKYKSNNIYNHSNATTRGEHAQCQQDASSSYQN